MTRAVRRVALVALACAVARPAYAQEGDVPPIGLGDLRVGHWVEIKGEVDSESFPGLGTRFIADEIELTPAEEYEGLVGTVQASPGAEDEVLLLEQPVSISDKTEWTNIDRGSDLVGRRVRIDGRFRGPRKLSARDIRRWGEGRDRIVGRIDAIGPVAGGYELEVMRYSVFVPSSAPVESEVSLDDLPLIPRRWKQAKQSGRINEDDILRERIQLAPGLRLGGQIELRTESEDEYDLDPDDDEDRIDTEAIARLRLAWRVSDNVFSRFEGRFRQRWREDAEDGSERQPQSRMGENWFYWRDLLGPGWDVQVGRQDFDDPREWIYDQNLDGLRLFRVGRSTRLELAAATSWGGDAGPRDRDALNLFGYLSNLDDDRHLALWGVHRDFQDGSRDSLTHLGARLLGEWLPDCEVWADGGLVFGEEEQRDVLGFAYDVGLTYEPDELPFRFSAGYAWASGDDGQGTDSAYRQTDLQDNNGRLGTVTSIRYYGELVRPELSNLGITTLAAAWWPENRTSLTFIWHNYYQVQTSPFLRDTEIDDRPDGVNPFIGTEFDVVLGTRRWPDLDIELIAGFFLPGDAFPDDAENSTFLRAQIRYRF